MAPYDSFPFLLFPFLFSFFRYLCQKNRHTSLILYIYLYTVFLSFLSLDSSIIFNLWNLHWDTSTFPSSYTLLRYLSYRDIRVWSMNGAQGWYTGLFSQPIALSPVISHIERKKESGLRYTHTHRYIFG